LSLHAAHALDAGEVTLEDLARRASRDITAGVSSTWSDRTVAASASEVLTATATVPPLTDMMLPGECAGAIAIVLASENRIRRAKQIRGWLTGWGVANSGHLSSSDWLEDPAKAARAASKRAYGAAGI